jgi:hypothetical protein
MSLPRIESRNPGPSFTSAWNIRGFPVELLGHSTSTVSDIGINFQKIAIGISEKECPTAERLVRRWRQR